MFCRCWPGVIAALERTSGLLYRGQYPKLYRAKLRKRRRECRRGHRYGSIKSAQNLRRHNAADASVSFGPRGVPRPVAKGQSSAAEIVSPSAFIWLVRFKQRGMISCL
jgi:hypothetical protein